MKSTLIIAQVSDKDGDEIFLPYENNSLFTG